MRKSFSNYGRRRNSFLWIIRIVCGPGASGNSSEFGVSSLYLDFPEMWSSILRSSAGGLSERARRFRRQILPALAVLIMASQLIAGCSGPNCHGDPELTKNVYIELVDWHIVGLWVINCPCCWIRVKNYNNVPIKDVCFRYRTYGYDGELLTVGTYKLEYDVPAGGIKNCIEQYIGLVDLESDMLSLEIVSVEAH